MIKDKLKSGVKAAKSVAGDRLDRALPDSEGFNGPSPNPKTNLVLADVALRGSGMLLRRGLERALLGTRYTPQKASKILKGRSMGQTLFGTAVARLATRSVPGAIVVGGALLAKTLYDRHRGKAAEIEGEMDMQDLAEEGAKQES